VVVGGVFNYVCADVFALLPVTGEPTRSWSDDMDPWSGLAPIARLIRCCGTARGTVLTVDAIDDALEGTSMLTQRRQLAAARRAPRDGCREQAKSGASIVDSTASVGLPMMVTSSAEARRRGA